MYSSPVRRFTSVLLHLLARLACIRRAASVRSEPGSNSQKKVPLELDPRATFSIHLTLLITHSIQLSKNNRVHHASRAIYYSRVVLSRGYKTKFLIGYFLRIRCDVSCDRDRPLGRIKSVLQVNNTSPKSQDLPASRKPSRRSTLTKSIMSRLRECRRMSQE